MTAAGQPSPASNGNSHDNGNEASSSKALHNRTPSYLDMAGGWVLPTAETATRLDSTAARCGVMGQAGVLTAILLTLLLHTQGPAQPDQDGRAQALRQPQPAGGQLCEGAWW